MSFINYILDFKPIQFSSVHSYFRLQGPVYKWNLELAWEKLNNLMVKIYSTNNHSWVNFPRCPRCLCAVCVDEAAYLDAGARMAQYAKFARAVAIFTLLAGGAGILSNTFNIFILSRWGGTVLIMNCLVGNHSLLWFGGLTQFWNAVNRWFYIQPVFISVFES